MKFSLDECAKATFKKRENLNKHHQLNFISTTIKKLEQEEYYKYLGIIEGDGIQCSQMKGKIKKEYCMRVRFVIKSKLNAANCIQAILAVPVVTYSFNVSNWKMAEISKWMQK